MSLEESLFEAALEKTSPQERAAFLDGVCRDDASLRARLDLLLEGHLQADGFLTTVPEREVPLSHAFPTENQGDMIDRYKLVEKLGEGGFGSVWAAEQSEPVKRRVALKIIKRMDTKQVVARFEAERQALALMDHPNIAKVFDAGATDTGRPYFVMELVQGVPITEYCDQEKLNTDDRLDLFIKVCHAVQHAHQKGIIHRDLKPSNILVTSHDGVSVPKVIDFGIAKATHQELTEKTIHTRFQQFIGTPSYMSPEQAEMSGPDIDTRSDIYSLGVLLYEILTGRPPFDSKELLDSGLDEMRKIIREKDPVRPSTRISQTHSNVSSTSPLVTRHSSLSTDLDWIVMKCLEKERARRYEAANGLAMDLVRHLNHEPIEARPPSRVYRLQKAWQRNRLVYTAGIAVAMALVTGIAVSAWQATVAERERNNAVDAQGRVEESALKLQYNLARQHLHLGQSLCERGKVAAGLHRMVRAIEAAPSGSEALVRDIENNLTAWRQQWAEPEMVLSHDSNAAAADFSPDGEHVITGTSEGELTLWSVPSGEKLWQRMARHGGIDRVKFSPDGTRILTAQDGGGTTLLHLWSANSGASIGQPIEWSGGDVAFSPDGQLLIASVERHMAQIYSAQNGEPVSPRLRHRNGYDLSLMSVAEASNLPTEGASLIIVALAGADLHIRIFDPKGNRVVDKPEAELLNGQALRDLKGLVNEDPLPQESDLSLEKTQELMATATSVADHTLRQAGFIRKVTFSPDGKLALVVTGGYIGTATIWNVDTGIQLGPALDHGRGIWVAAFGPQGKTVATGCEDGSIHVWSVKTRARLFPIMRHEKKVFAIAFHPDGDRLLTASEDLTARLWSTENGEPIGDTMRHDSWIKSASFSPDGNRVLTAGGDGTARLWSAETGSPLGPPLRHMERFVMGASFSPKGDLILTLTHGRVRSLWNVQDIGPTAHLLDSEDKAFGNVTARPSPDGSLVARGIRWPKGPVRIFDTTTREPLPGDILHKSGVWTLAFSPLGEHLVTGGEDRMLRFWDVASRQPLEITPLEHEEKVRDVAYSADGKIIATASRAARLWSATDGSPLSPPLEHPKSVQDVALSRDGEILVTGCKDGYTRVWSVKSAQELLPPLGQGGSVDISQDCGLIATGDGTLAKFWDLKSGRQTSMVLAHDGPVRDVTFSAYGRWLLSASDDGTVRLWSIETGEQIGPNLLPVSDALPFECVFSPNGKQVVIADHTYGTWIVDLPALLDQPHPDSRLWIEVITRQEMDEQGTMTWIEPDDWLAKRKQWAALGGPSVPQGQN